jgi:pyruvate dehydrogenase E2 component (dihydrolipoamide acetyltransferase)
MTEVRVPDIGDFDHVPVIEVLVTAGDTVAPEDPLIVLESDKATMEVPAPAAGTIAEISVSVGDTVSEGDLILTLSGDGAGAPDAPREQAAQAPVPEGEGTVYAGPGVRRLAREMGVDLAGITGSGPKGRITKDDLAAHGAAPAPAPPVATPPPVPAGDDGRFGPTETVPLSRIARIAGPLLARNWATIPHVTQFDEADITDLEAFRVEVNAAHAAEGVKLTMVSLLLKAAAATLQAFPSFNASLEGEGLVLKRYYHLGFAADTPAGLMVPVIRDVDRKGLLEIARELATLSQAAREGTISFAQMQGGTFTISSLGGIGGTAFTPIINAPEVAILGASRAAMKPVWIDGAFQPRLMLPLSLSYDHRVVDGAAGARFTTHLAGLLRRPLQMLL